MRATIRTTLSQFEDSIATGVRIAVENGELRADAPQAGITLQIISVMSLTGLITRHASGLDRLDELMRWTYLGIARAYGAIPEKSWMPLPALNTRGSGQGNAREKSMKILKIAATVLALAAATCAASAQEWPSRPIRVIIPFAAGSATDTMTRPVLDQLSKQLGQPIVVENRGGGGGTIGMGAVANAEPDGYTLLVYSNTLTVVPSTYKNPGFDTERDFVGVSPMASLPMAIVVAPSKGYTSVKDFIEKGKAKPGTVNFASAGTGGVTHLGAERLLMSAGVEAIHVPYKGSADALRDVMTGLVDFYLCPVGVALPLVQDKKLAALAVTSSQRSAAMPDLPTTVEAGFPNSDYNVWVGMFAPSKTPPPIVERLHDEITKALQTPEIKAIYQKLAADPMIVSLKQFNDTIRDEIKMNAGLVKALNLPVN